MLPTVTPGHQRPPIGLGSEVIGNLLSASRVGLAWKDTFKDTKVIYSGEFVLFSVLLIFCIACILTHLVFFFFFGGTKV
jgi:hypothetical protein